MKAWIVYDPQYKGFDASTVEPTWCSLFKEWKFKDNDYMSMCSEETKKILGKEYTMNPRHLIEVEVKLKQVWEPCS